MKIIDRYSMTLLKAIVQLYCIIDGQQGVGRGEPGVFMWVVGRNKKREINGLCLKLKSSVRRLLSNDHLKQSKIDALENKEGNIAFDTKPCMFTVCIKLQVDEKIKQMEK